MVPNTAVEAKEVLSWEIKGWGTIGTSSRLLLLVLRCNVIKLSKSRKASHGLTSIVVGLETYHILLSFLVSQTHFADTTTTCFASSHGLRRMCLRYLSVDAMEHCHCDT